MGLLFQQKQSQTGSFRGATATDRYDYSIRTPQGETKEYTQQIPLNAPEPKSLSQETGLLPWQEEKLRATRGNVTYTERMAEIAKRDETARAIQESESLKKKPSAPKEEEKKETVEEPAGGFFNTEKIKSDVEKAKSWYGDKMFDLFYGYDPERKRVLEADEIAFDKNTGETNYLKNGEKLLIKSWDNMSLIEKAGVAMQNAEYNAIGRPLSSDVGVGLISGVEKGVLGMIASSAQLANMAYRNSPIAGVPKILQMVEKTGKAKTFEDFKNLKVEDQDLPGTGALTDWAHRVQQTLSEDFAPKSFGMNEDLFHDKDGEFKFNSKILRNPEYVASAIGQQIPNLAFMIGTWGTLGGWGEGILGAGAALDERRIQHILKGETEVTTIQDHLFAGTIGVINGMLGRWGMKGVLEGNPMIQKLIINKLGNKFLKVMAESGLATLGEATTEAIQEIIPALAAKTLYKEDITFEEIGRRASQAFTQALVSTAPIATYQTATRQMAASRAEKVQATIENESLEGQQNQYGDVETKTAAQETTGKNAGLPVGKEFSFTDAKIDEGTAMETGKFHNKTAALEYNSALDEISDRGGKKLVQIKVPIDDVNFSSQLTKDADFIMVDSIKQSMMDGVEVPPPVVRVNSKGELTVLDGRHRTEAFRESGAKEINIIVNAESAARVSAPPATHKIVYHGEGGEAQSKARQLGLESKYGKGLYLTDNQGVAQTFAGKDGAVTDYAVDPNAKTLTFKSEGELQDYTVKALKAFPESAEAGDAIQSLAKQQGYQIIDSSKSMGDELAGMLILDTEAISKTTLNPKLIQGRVQDVAMKINTEFGEEASTKFKADMEGKTFDSYEQMVAEAEKVLDKMDLPSYAKHLVPVLVGSLEGESKIMVQRQYRDILERLDDKEIKQVEKFIVSPLTKEDLAAMTESQRGILKAALGTAVQLSGEGAGVVAQNIEVLDTGEVQASQPVSTGTRITPAGEKVPPVQTTLPPGEVTQPPKTVVQPPSKTPPMQQRVRVTDDTIETHTQTMQALDQRIADSTGSAREKSMLDRANLREKIFNYLKKNTETHFELLGGKSKSGYILATKEAKGGKFGSITIPNSFSYNLMIGTKTSTKIFQSTPGKFSTREAAIRAGLQQAIKTTEAGRRSGAIPVAAAMALRTAIRKTNRTLGKEGLPTKKVKKVVKEAKKTVVAKAKPKVVSENMETATPQAKMLAADLAKKSKFSAEKILTKAQEIAGKKTQVGTEHIAKALNELNQVKTKVPVGQMASAGAMVIGNWEQVAAKEGGEPFKLYEKSIGLIRKYAERIGEGHLPRGTQGVFKRMTNNIRVKGLSAIGVVAHEVAHYLDVANTRISERIINETTRGDKLRKRLTDLYEEFYPGGRRSHKLSTRIVEAFATLLQKYAEMPNTIQAKYPDLVQMVFDKNGKYYNPIFTEIITDLRQISGEYQALSPLDKFGARITKKRLETGKKPLTSAQMARETATDAIYPLEVGAMKSGKWFQKGDPSLWARWYGNAVPAILQHNIMGQKIAGRKVGYVRIKDGTPVETLPYTWKDLVDKVFSRKVQDDFDNFLVARRVYYEYQELHELENMKFAEEELSFLKVTDPTAYEKAREMESRREQLQDITKNDEFTEIEATEAFHAGDGLFTEEAEMFDALNKEDLKFLHDPAVMLINNSSMRKLSSTKGYAGMKRAMFDDIVGDAESQPQTVGVGKNRISTLVRRHGSTHTIISPVATAIWTHAEILRKGSRQIVYNKSGEQAHLLPELFDRLELKSIPDPETGVISFPQESNPNIIMARIGYKRVPFLVDATIKRTLDEVLSFQDIDTFGKAMVVTSRMFTKGTTGLFLQFTGLNIIIDQVTALANSQYRFIPLYDPIKALYKVLLDKNSEEARFGREYLIFGGERQTIMGWQNASAEEVLSSIAKEKKGLARVGDIVNEGLDWFGLLPKWSEIATRMSEYIKSRQAGEASIVALERAGRVTAPFHHKGRLGKGNFWKTWVKAMPFANPAIQVLDQSLRQLTDTPKSRKRMIFVVAGITAAQLGSMALMVGGSSDEQKRKYLQLTPEDLGSYLWFPLPNGKDLFKWRIPSNLAFFGTFFNMVIAQKALGADYSGKEFYQGATSFLPTQLNPITDVYRSVFSWLPQMLKVPILMAANLKDYPKLIPLESQSMQRKTPEMRYNENTAKIAKWLGKTFGISPIKFDYLMTGYFGRAWGYVGIKPSAYGIADKFIQQEYFESGRLMQRYYDAKEINDQEYTTYKKDPKKYKELVKVNAEKARLKRVDDLLEQYRDIDEEKSPVRAEQLRTQILASIRKMNL